MMFNRPDQFPDEELVEFIREVCAHELKQPMNYPFFWDSWEYNERPDEALLRLFQEEFRSGASMYHTILVMCHG